MTDSLIAQLGVGERELVAFVGAGGKSTLLFRLGDELAAQGAKVVLTTTTKMGTNQARLIRCVGPGAAEAALDGPGPVMVVAQDDGHKVTGPPPTAVDVLFAESGADYVLVEADGARGKSFKAPASHEPVIPTTSTLVVIVAGADAIGRPIAEQCHRPELVAELAGLSIDDALHPAAAVRVLTHPEGVLRAVPVAARVVVAITKSDGAAADAAALQWHIDDAARFDRCVMVPSM